MSRVEQLSSWHADWTGLRVAVAGLDAEGFSVADTLVELGAHVTVYSAGAHSADRADLLAVIGADLAPVNVGVDDGGAASTHGDTAPMPSPTDAKIWASGGVPDLVVTTSSDGPEAVLGEAALAQGIPVWSELELAWRLRDKTGTPAPWLVLAGSRDLARPAQLAEAMLLADGRRAMACGAALGVPVLDAIRVPQGWDSLVVAASARALAFSSSIAPWSSACIGAGNGDPSEYDPLLARVYERTRVACVYDHGVPATMRMVENADVAEGCRAIGVGLGVPGPSDFGVVEGILCDRAFLDDRRTTALEFATLDLLRGRGLSTPDAVVDVLTAAAFTRSVGVSIGSVHTALVGTTD